MPSARFVLYADRWLQQPVTLAALRTAFGLDAATVVVCGDPHYR
ncbi:hypothetical protein [Methylorubrum aminovorans]